MAQRPVFVGSGAGCVSEVGVTFEWHAGMSPSQKRKSVRALHEAAAKNGLCPILEVSTKSDEPLGRALSALCLRVTLSGVGSTPVECAFQGGKVFAHGGPYRDLYHVESLSAKRDPRLRESGALIAFDLMGDIWPLNPTTAFYDWLYLQALVQNPDLANQLPDYVGFTDIEFNPKRSLNTQAQSCALYVALRRAEVCIPELLCDRMRFIGRVTQAHAPSALSLFG